MTISTQCGYVAIIGRPNVGKSTLLNHIIGQKLSITCDKPQTTRHQILGVKTQGTVQSLYVDTPGIHRQQKNALNRYMNKSATSLLQDVDVLVWVIEPFWTGAEDYILERLSTSPVPVILVINKVDQVKDKTVLLPFIQEVSQKRKFVDIIPLSAKSGQQLEKLEACIGQLLPVKEFMFDPDELTDRPVRFLVSEIIREKLMRYLGDELPYCLTVEVDLFEERPEDRIVHIAATIIVERDSQKPIVIGAQGERLKQIGREARLDIKKLIEKPVFLQLWVKVRAGWMDDERALRTLGYGGG